jgi:transposase
VASFAQGIRERFWRRIIALSLDIREKVMKVIDGGVSRRKAAAQFDIGVTTAIRWARRVQITGSVVPGRMGGDRRSHRIEAHADFLRGEIDANPRVTIMELREKLKGHCGMSFGYATVWRLLARHKFTHKRTTAHAAEQDREDVAAAREAWFERQIELDPAKLVFIDETSVSTNMARRFGWALQGERCRASVPFGHWKTTTLVAGLRVDGVTAAMTVDGALDGPGFLAYINQRLSPTLTEGDVVVMDNVRTHKVAGVRETIEAKGARLLYLPPYSPDFNPIEKCFSKIKAFLRAAAARSLDNLLTAIRDALDACPACECVNYFAACGYDAF